MLFTDGEVNVGCTSYPVMKEAAEDSIRRIQMNSIEKSVNRHIVISVVAFGSEPHRKLKLLSDAGNGLYYLMNLSDNPDCTKNLPSTFAAVLGSTRCTANNIVLKIQPNPQVSSVIMVYEFLRLAITTIEI